MRRTGRLLVGLMLIGTANGCADDKLEGLGDPAIEVIDPAGNSHIDAMPSLQVAFDSAGEPDPVELTLDILSRGEKTLELFTLCIVEAADAAAALSAPDCVEGGAGPFRFPDRRGGVRGGEATELPITYAPLAAGPRRAFLRIGSNAQNSPVVVVELAGTAVEWPPACFAREVTTAEELSTPADIVWVIDSSSSMSEENDLVQGNLNTFSADITASGIDHRVVVIGDSGEITVPPPLGGSTRFRAVDTGVSSNDGLQEVLDHYPDYQDFLRPDSVKHLVAVSDDNSDLSAADFTMQLNALTNPGFAPSWVFHSIVAYGDVALIGCANNTSWGAAIGEEYLDLSSSSGGVTFPICEQDWTPVFDAIEGSVVVESYLPCELPLPTAPPGTTLDTSVAAVRYLQPGAPAEQLAQVTNATACAPDGWYFDDPAAPTQVIICERSCDALRQSGDGWLEVVLGCQ